MKRAISIFVALVAMASSPSVFAADAAKPVTAIIAGGCFWCLEAVFDEMKGVLSVDSGYSNGHMANPSLATRRAEWLIRLTNRSAQVAPVTPKPFVSATIRPRSAIHNWWNISGDISIRQ